MKAESVVNGSRVQIALDNKCQSFFKSNSLIVRCLSNAKLMVCCRKIHFIHRYFSEYFTEIVPILKGIMDFVDNLIQQYVVSPIVIGRLLVDNTQNLALLNRLFALKIFTRLTRLFPVVNMLLYQQSIIKLCRTEQEKWI